MSNMSKPIIEASAGRAYGHVPGHQYCDADLFVRRTRRGGVTRYLATILITWGSAQGYDDEHGRVEYAACDADMMDAIDAVRREALAEESDEATRRYVETACARAMRGAAAA